MASLPIAAVGVHCDGCLPQCSFSHFERGLCWNGAVFPARSHGLDRLARALPPVARLVCVGLLRLYRSVSCPEIKQGYPLNLSI